MTNLDVFQKITHISDCYIEDAALPPISSAVSNKDDGGESVAYRFFHSGWWVAILCAVVSMTVLFGIVLAGRQRGNFVTPAGTEGSTTAETDTQPPETQYIPQMEWTAELSESTVRCGDTCTVFSTLTADASVLTTSFTLFLVHDALSAEWTDFCYAMEFDSDSGSWSCTLPANAPVGTYTLRAEIPLYGWSEEIKGILTVTPRENAFNPEFPLTVLAGGYQFTPLANVCATGEWRPVTNEDGFTEYFNTLGDYLIWFEHSPEEEIAKMSTIVLDETPQIEITEGVRCSYAYLYYHPEYEQPKKGYSIEELDEGLSILDPGVYYLAYTANIAGEDHAEEILASELKMEELFGFSKYEKYVQELEKNSKYFTDYVYEYCFIRIIVP